MILGERFYKLSNALFSYHLTPIQFTVYNFLVSSAGQKEKCWPSMKTIAANCHCSETTAREAIAALEQKGGLSGGSSDTRIGPTAASGRPATPTTFRSSPRSPPPGDTPPREAAG